MSENNRKILVVIIVLIFSAGAIFLLKSNEKETVVNEVQKVVKLVEAQKVTLSTNEAKIPISGQLNAANKVTLFSEVNGILLNANFKTGNAFKKGEVIVQLKNADLRSNLKAQKSGLLTLTAKLVADLQFEFPNAVDEWDNFLNQLDIEKQLPSYPTVEDKKLKLFVAGRNFFQTYYNVLSLEETLNKYTIIAPFDGFLSSALIQPGSLVRGGQQIGEFSEMSKFEIKLDIPIHIANQVSIDDPIVMQSSDVSGEFTGKIVRINPVLDPVTQRISVFASLSDIPLNAGMYLSGYISKSLVENSFFVNRNLLNGDELPFIIDNELQFKKVKIVQMLEEQALVTGLNEGDILLKLPIKGAYNGMPVRFEF